MNPSFSRKLALALITCAVVGVEISYHFTLESRFDAIEQKLTGDATAMQQLQDSVDTLASSKTQTLAGLNKQIDALQSSCEPLGKTTAAQTDALAQLRRQITSLQQAQVDQVTAQKKLSDYIAQLEKARAKDLADQVAAQKAAAVKPAVFVAPAPGAISPSASNAAPAPSISSVMIPDPGMVAVRALPLTSTEPAGTKVAMLPAAPNPIDVMELRTEDVSPRAQPAQPPTDSISR